MEVNISWKTALVFIHINITESNNMLYFLPVFDFSATDKQGSGDPENKYYKPQYCTCVRYVGIIFNF